VKWKESEMKRQLDFIGLVSFLSSSLRASCLADESAPNPQTKQEKPTQFQSIFPLFSRPPLKFFEFHIAVGAASSLFNQFFSLFSFSKRKD